jgi:hypothetical protein
MTTLVAPTTKARREARAKKDAEPGSAMGRSAPRVRRDVRATGPVWSQGDDAKNAAAMGARAAT